MIKKLRIVIASVIITSGAMAQSPGQQLAQKIALKMKDTLSLTSQEKDEVYAINIGLQNQKMNIRQQYAGSDSLGIYLQRAENTRDSLYRTILSEEKYLMYRQKKRNLVSNN